MIKRLGILRGGRPEYYHPSIKEGGEILSFVLKHLQDKYKPVDILIDEEGVWYISGIPVLPAELMHKVDLVWNAAHPEYSNTLRQFSIPNVSSSRTTHAIRESREMLREHMDRIDIKIPRVIISPRDAREVFEKIPPPWLVEEKIIQTFTELIQILQEKENVEVEEIISDKIARVHAVGGFRGEDVYILPIEKLNAVEKEEVATLVRKLYGHLGAEHYLYTAFYLHPKRGVFLKDLRLLPDLAEGSHLHRASELIGSQTHNIISHILERARAL